YFNFSGLTYSQDAILGSAVEGTHYYREVYGYDSRGRQESHKNANGTIQWTVYDGLGRVTSQWIGTNDTVSVDPITSEPRKWSPDLNGTGTSNLVKVAEYVYDEGGVGDGNLTQTI